MSRDMVSIQVHGVKPTLEYLRRFEPEVYQSITKEMRKAAAPLRSQVAKAFPSQTDVVRSDGRRQWELYGHSSKQKKRSDRGETGYTFPRYNSTQVRRGVKTQVGGRKNRLTNTYPILRIKQTDGAGAIYDMAAQGNSRSGQSFVGRLKGSPSRVMWPTVIRGMNTLRPEIEKIINRVERRFTAEIAADVDRRAAQSAQASKQIRDALGRFGRSIR